MKRSKKNQPPAPRSLGDQLREAFPPSKADRKAKTGKQPKARRPPTVRIIPAAPTPPPEAPRRKSGRPKKSVAPKVTPWEPSKEEVFLEEAFPDDAARHLLPEAPVTPIRAPMSASPAPGIRRTADKVRIQVGLDFGTSSTKVLWVRTGVPDRRVQAMDFGHGLADVPRFCIPSIAAFDTRGQLLLGDIALRHMKSGPAEGALTRFKMLVAGEQDERYLDRYTQERFREHLRQARCDESVCTPEVISATYLAYVMRRVRLALASEFSDIDLAFATCVPVDQVQHNTVMRAFRRVADAAQRVEREASDTETGRQWLDRAMRAMTMPPLDQADTRVDLVAEAVAATAGYVHSIQRATGLHALIDLGAGTTDISIFNIHGSGNRGPETVWYAAQSIPRGTSFTEARLAAELRKLGRSPAKATVLALLSGTRTDLPGAPALVREELDCIWEKTQEAWRTGHLHLKNQSNWTRDAVNVFLSGGGALIPQAQSVFCESWMQNPNWGPYPCQLVPDPDGYDPSRVGGPFIRINVAYGLTVPIPELGKYVLPNDAPDDTPPPLPRREDDQDGDQLVPRYGWT